MKRTLAVAATFLLAPGFAPAQGNAAATSELVVGSGNYFSPIVRDLDAAIAFYRDGLGFDVQGPPGDASDESGAAQHVRPAGRFDTVGNRPHAGGRLAASRWSRSAMPAEYRSSGASRIPAPCAWS